MSSIVLYAMSYLLNYRVVDTQLLYLVSSKKTIYLHTSIIIYMHPTFFHSYAFISMSVKLNLRFRIE